jgi:hypothetical protein
MMRFRGGGVGHKSTREATDFFKNDRDPLDERATGAESRDMNSETDDELEDNCEEEDDGLESRDMNSETDELEETVKRRTMTTLDLTKIRKKTMGTCQCERIQRMRTTRSQMVMWAVIRCWLMSRLTLVQKMMEGLSTRIWKHLDTRTCSCIRGIGCFCHWSITLCREVCSCWRS